MCRVDRVLLLQPHGNASSFFDRGWLHAAADDQPAPAGRAGAGAAAVRARAIVERRRA